MCGIILSGPMKEAKDMVDTSLLNKEGSITIEDLKEHFRLNDFSALTSNYKSKTATSEQNEI